MRIKHKVSFKYKGENEIYTKIFPHDSIQLSLQCICNEAIIISVERIETKTKEEVYKHALKRLQYLASKHDEIHSAAIKGMINEALNYKE